MRRLVGVLALCVAVAACGSDGDDDAALEGLDTPRFEPDTASEGATSTQPAGVEGGPATTSATTAAPGEESAETTTSVAGDQPASEPAATRELVEFDDPVGDAVGGLDQDPPAWADLAGASLERQGDAYRLTVRLGDTAPETAPGEETMNIASFYDTDGDGGVDYEIWANLGPDGWGAVWYDDQGNAAPGDASNVTVVVEGDEVRLLFPDVMLDRPDRLRFSIASEYGELSVIGSSAAHRDDAPDDDEAVRFPS